MGILLIIVKIAILVHGLTAAITGYYPGKANRSAGGVDVNDRRSNFPCNAPTGRQN
jgi:hypothetical protein